MGMLATSKILAHTEQFPLTSDAVEVLSSTLAAVCCNRHRRDREHCSQSADRHRLSQGQGSVTWRESSKMRHKLWSNSWNEKSNSPLLTGLSQFVGLTTVGFFS